jgi:hypothetical protein
MGGSRWGKAAARRAKEHLGVALVGTTARLMPAPPDTRPDEAPPL